MKQTMIMERERQLKLAFDYGVTREQACIMCHLSSGCPDCCNKCRREGRNGGCYGQACSIPGRGHAGQRWEAWLHLVSTSLPELRKFLPPRCQRRLKGKE